MITTTKTDVSNIYDIFFKVKISSNEEREKLVNHLQKAGFFYPDDDIDKSEVIGLLVGNGYIGEMLFEHSIADSQNDECTVEEVLNMTFGPVMEIV